MNKPKGSKKVVKEWLPMPNKIVVEVVEDKKTWDRAGRIIKPDTLASPRTTGRVIAVYAPFVNEKDLDVESFLEVGDYIVFGKHGGIELQFGEEKVVVLAEREILTKVIFLEEAEQVQHAPSTPQDDMEG